MEVDVLILVAGAAGVFCGAQAGHRGKRVLVLDHAAKPLEKVRISGGGRCNFTNIHTDPARFLSDNPHFAKSALARYTPMDFLEMLARHQITWHEKTLGQLFCDEGSGRIIQMLRDELKAGGGELQLGVQVNSVSKSDDKFRVESSAGVFQAPSLVIATGGLSIPKMGATRYAYDVARQFDHDIVSPRAGLVPFTFSGTVLEGFASLSGISCPVRVTVGNVVFDEAMLFTHRGLSGPAMLQASSYWREGKSVMIDLFAGRDGAQELATAKTEHPKQIFSRVLEAKFPKRFVDGLVLQELVPSDLRQARMADISHKALAEVARAMSHWQVKPSGTEGWRTAEVTVGGVDTRGLSSKSMESLTVPGLYFIGECVDVTGWLGGYNFQWAWASAFAAAQSI